MIHHRSENENDKEWQNRMIPQRWEILQNTLSENDKVSNLQERCNRLLKVKRFKILQLKDCILDAGQRYRLCCVETSVVFTSIVFTSVVLSDNFAKCKVELSWRGDPIHQSEWRNTLNAKTVSLDKNLYRRQYEKVVWKHPQALRYSLTTRTAAQLGSSLRGDTKFSNLSKCPDLLSKKSRAPLLQILYEISS